MKHLVIIGKAAARSWNAFFPDFPDAFTTASSRAAMHNKLPEFLGLCLEEYPIPKKLIQSISEIDTSELEGLTEIETQLITALEINPISLEVARVIDQSQLSATELAKRMHTTPSALSRLRDPKYTGHSIAALTRLANAVGAKLTVRLET